MISKGRIKRDRILSVQHPMTGDSLNIEEQGDMGTSQTMDRPMPSGIAEIGSRDLK